MNSSTSPSDLADLRVSLDSPNLERIKHHLDRCLNDCGPYLDQYRHDFETRFALWDGQSRDGRRWQTNAGTCAKVKPWNGASDVRAFAADQIIIENVELMMASFRRAEFRTTALRALNAETSQKVNTLLNWRTKNHLAEELERELELAAQWREMYNISVLGIWWRQERRFTLRTVKLEELEQKAMAAIEAGDPQGVQTLQQLVDPLMDEQTITRMVQMSPVLDRQGAKKILKELRDKGEARVPQIIITENQPCWEALRMFLDVFTDVENRSFDTARWAAKRCVLSGEDLVEKIQSEGWDEQWVTQLWQSTRGKCYSGLDDFRSMSLKNERGNTFSRGNQSRGSNFCSEDQVEVWHHYYKAIEKKSGAPVLLRLVWSPQLPASYGHHDTFDYAHGKLPFREMVRERVETAMVDGRSVPEIATTAQNTIKKQRDSENDYADMTTLPPLIVPFWRSSTRIELGPDSQQAEKKPGEIRFMAPPSTGVNVAASIEERTIRTMASYFGLSHPDIAPGRIALAQEHRVGGWLRQIASCMRMHLALEQQYLDYATAEKVVGDPSSVVQISREDIQGQFTVSLIFDPANLDPERVKTKLQAFKEFVLAIDTEGTIRRGPLAAWGARQLDAELAAEIVQSPQQASQREIDDEENNVTKITAGVEPQMVTEGQNYQLRLTTLLQTLEKNPFLKRRMLQNPDSMAMLEARVKHLEAMIVQYGENREIGRAGARPGLEEMQQKLIGGGAAL